MAMINCPECGQQISDKARKCIHCGKVFIEEEIIEENIKCSECGTALEKTDEICPNCGCPVNVSTNAEIKPQQVEVASIRITKKTKGIVIGVIIAIILCGVGSIGYKVYSDKKADEKYQEEYNEYISNLEQVQILMLAGGSEAESLCNLTLRVWGNAIYEKRDEKTDKYTRKDGFFVADFNRALANLYADSDTQNTISDIESNRESVKTLIKELQNPPDGLDNCYDTVSDLHEAYNILIDLAVSPSGNYSGFSSNKSDAVSDFMSAYEKLDSQIPEKIKEK